MSRSKKREYFTKGRNTYPLTIDGDVESVMFSAPPTTVHSKQESSSFDALMMDTLAPSTLDLITKSLANVGRVQTKHRRRKEKKTVKAVDEDLDMFADWRCLFKPTELLLLHLTTPVYVHNCIRDDRFVAVPLLHVDQQIMNRLLLTHSYRHPHYSLQASGQRRR